MNILNPIYFEEAEIRTAFVNICATLAEGAYLLVGRTDLNGVNQATIFQKSDGRVLSVYTHNKGSEILPLLEKLDYT